MADRKCYIVPNSSANLLFSAAPEFNLNLPFIPVSQVTGPDDVLPDDSTEVREKDRLPGQTSANLSTPSSFKYFFSSESSSHDPFASIGHQPCSPLSDLVALPETTSPTSVAGSVPSTAPPPPPGSQTNSVPAFTSTVYLTPMGQNTPQGSQQSFNPYRHTPISSKARPYISAPELQSSPQPPPQQNPYSLGLPLQETFQMADLTFTKPPPPQILTPSPPPPPTTDLVLANPTTLHDCNVYEPVQPHWFYCEKAESTSAWLPFSIIDSIQLEETYNSVQPDPENVIVCTDGGRYDVHLCNRTRTAAYWEEEPTEIRRCTWFYKGDSDSHFIPYSEEFSDKLEGEYKKSVSTNQWQRRLEFPSGETIVMHNPNMIVQFQSSAMPDELGTAQDCQTRPRVVKRGIDDDHDEVPDGELPKVDHLVFMVHGNGPVCDLRCRSVVGCVDDFRTVSLTLMQSHFKKSQDEHVIRRVEFLPVQWHAALHGDATGVDRKIRKITLPSAGRLRHFTNKTLLDVLIYNSPTYCQTIIDTVTLEINRLHALFMKRNPDYTGAVSVVGHGLGSLILFDLLSNQKNISPQVMPTMPTTNEVPTLDMKRDAAQAHNTLAPCLVEEPKDEGDEFEDLSAVLQHLGLSEYKSTFDEEKIDVESLLMCTIEDLKEMGIPLGPRKRVAKFVKDTLNKQATLQAAQEKKMEVKDKEVVAPQAVPEPLPDHTTKLRVGRNIYVDYNYFEVGTGQVSVSYRALDFEPVNFFALGSPIAMFLTVRGLEKIEESYQLPTCKGFFNIYHPLDSVAYRIEPMIVPHLDLQPFLIPHHKGRKRMHLELKESLSKMGSDLKYGFISSLKTAWQTLNEFARFHTSSAQLQVELAMVADQIKEVEEKQLPVREERNVSDGAEPHQGEVEEKQVLEERNALDAPETHQEDEPPAKIGMLNGGRRIDYVLQEKPIESFNEYIFSLQSHQCYWESEDTALFILKEVYESMGISIY